MQSIVQASPIEVRDALAGGEILLIDVREPREYAVERIPGALLYPLSTFDPKAIPSVGRRLVVQCGGGGRSMRAAQALVDAGHAQVANLEGGIKAWKSQGLPLIRVDAASGEVVERGSL